MNAVTCVHRSVAYNVALMQLDQIITPIVLRPGGTRTTSNGLNMRVRTCVRLRDGSALRRSELIVITSHSYVRYMDVNLTTEVRRFGIGDGSCLLTAIVRGYLLMCVCVCVDFSRSKLISQLTAYH